jgi:hypothetical protein
MYVENSEPIHKPTMLTVGYNGVKYHAQNGECAGKCQMRQGLKSPWSETPLWKAANDVTPLSRKRYAQAEAVFRFYEQSFASYGYADLCDDSL